jgi:hypothetical protein
MSPEMRDVIQRQLLETLIRMNLLVLESQRLSTPVSTAEAESALKLDPFFSPGGQFDAAKWNLTRSTQAARFQSALATSRERVGARKLEDQVQARYRPRESDLRDQALRQLRRAFTEDVSLRVADFDGKIHEPRETDVLAYYARNKEQFRLTERAVLSVSFINEPPRTRLEQQDAAAGAAWTARMKRTARGDPAWRLAGGCHVGLRRTARRGQRAARELPQLLEGEPGADRERVQGEVRTDAVRAHPGPGGLPRRARGRGDAVARPGAATRVARHPRAAAPGRARES